MKTYDPKEILAVFNGILITGYAEDSFLSAAMDEDAFTKKTGAGGEVVRTRSNNRGGSVTFTLMQSSPVNDLLSAMGIGDRLAGSGVGPLSVKDNLGTTVIAAENAWIKKVSDVEFGKEAGSREWVIDCEALEIFSGGANP